MEPSATAFTSHHTFHAGPEDDGLPSWVDQSARALTANLYQTDTIHSVLLASGLYVDVGDKLSEIPGRHQANFKATVAWFVTLCFAGIGMFIEAYVIITTGQVKTVWDRQYPTCWEPDSNQLCPYNIECIGLFPNTPDESSEWSPDPNICDTDGAFPSSMLCSENSISAVSYSGFAGIMTGMLVFGMVADVIGRKRAGVLTSAFMIVGIAGMIFFNASFVNTLFAAWAAFFGIFGTGVGGEYPLSASLAAEQHIGHVDTAKLDNVGQRQQRIRLDLARTVRRGESIALVFSMQGVGAVFGSLVLLALIYFGQQAHVDCSNVSSNSSGNNPEALNGIWRAFYFIGLLQVLVLFVYRGVISKESTTFEKVKGRKQKRKDKYGAHVTWKILGFYAPRLVGTASCWLLWNVGFYGLMLYSGPIFKAFNPDGSLIVNNGLILLNNVVSLVGYYCAALTIDKKPLGRRRLQMLSFMMCSMIFLITGGIFDTASSALLMFLFFAGSFFGQFGANVTTYVMAAETYPTEFRSTCHGLSAFAGKLGALLATVAFSYVSTRWIFFITGMACLFGLIMTWIFSVDLTHVSLSEHDAQLELVVEGRPEKYKGRLNQYEHLSNFEYWTGRHGEFDERWAFKLVAEELDLRVSKDEDSGYETDEAGNVYIGAASPQLSPKSALRGSWQHFSGNNE